MRAAILLLTCSTVTAATIASAQAQPLSNRPAVTVQTFEYGTVVSQLSGDTHVRRRLEHHGLHDPTAFAAALGTGVADLVVEKLIESGRFRVFERRQLEAVRGEQSLEASDEDGLGRARYIISGSISRLGLNDRKAGGVAAFPGGGSWLGRIGGLGVKTSGTTMHLTVRVIDTRTGEIVGSFTGEGKSDRRWGVTGFGIVPGGAGGTQVADENFRETAIGEAASRAAIAVVEQIIALRATRMAGGA